VSQTRLAELAEEGAMTMVRIIDRMEAYGLIERRPDLANRRARSLFLTLEARPVLERIWLLGYEIRTEVTRQPAVEYESVSAFANSLSTALESVSDMARATRARAPGPACSPSAQRCDREFS
jgi:DNA-binding MarR family transcriptional regulator